MKVKAKTVIKKAKSYVGTKENPPNSNNVIFNTHYYGHTVNGPQYPWCCTFAWDIFRMCKASELFFGGNKTAYCPAVYEWAKQNKLIVKNPKKGDLILFDWDKDNVADHIGFYYRKSSGDTFETIEGNTGIGNDSNGGQVMIRTRYKNQVLCFIRPKYKKVVPVKPVKVPKPVIEYGDNGENVKQLQECLNYVMNEELKLDGDFGSKTKRVLTNFKAKYKTKRNGLTLNGSKYGKAAYKAMKKAI